MLSKSTTILISAAVLLVGVLMVFNVKNNPGVVAEGLSRQSTTNNMVWPEFISQGGEFIVRMPELPQHLQDAVNISHTDKKRKYEIYVSEKKDGSIFMIYRITYPEDFNTSNSQVILADVINEIITTNPNNRIIKNEETFYADYAARNFEIDNKDFTVEGLAFMDDKVVYVLTYATGDEIVNKSEYQYFIESFHLLSRATK